MTRPARRRWADVAWTVGGVALYALCINMFGGYPAVHSEALNSAGVGLVVVLGIVVWYRDERDDDEPDED